MKQQLLFMSVLIGFQTAHAVEKCSIGNLTERCEYFKKQKDKPEIVLPDGKRYPNPVYGTLEVSAVPQVDQLPSPDPATMAEALDKNLALQEEIISTLGEEYNSKFLLAVSSPLTGATIGSASETGGQGVKLTLPWPAKRSAGSTQIKSVDWAEFESDFLNKLPQGKKELIRDRFQQMYKNNVSAYSGMGGYSGGGLGGGAVARQNPPQSKETVQEMEARQKKDVRRAEELVKKAKDLLLSEISQGKPYSSLRGDQKALYDKVNTIKYVSPLDATTSLNPVCAGAEVNAFYMPMDHTFTLCPGMVSYPDSSLIMVIAHELGHSIDPCGCSRGFYTADKKKISAALSSNFEKSGKSAEIAMLAHLLQYQNRLSFDPQALESEGVVEFLNRGLLKEESPPIPWKRYPQALPLSCLKKQIGLRTVTDEMLTAERLQEERFKKNVYFETSQSEAEIRDEIHQRTDNPDCRQSIFGHAEAGEAMADAWGAKVLGRYLEENPPKNRDEQIAAFSTHLAGQEVCGTPDPKRLTNQRSHPFSLERINDILMADHRVQKALNCEGDSKNSCLKSMGTLRTPGPVEGSGSEKVEGQR